MRKNILFIKEKKNDLYIEHKISLIDSLCGCQFTIDHFDEPRDEFVLVVAGSNEILSPISNESLLDAVALELGKLKKSGYHARDAVAQVAGQHKLSRKIVYQLWLDQEG